MPAPVINTPQTNDATYLTNGLDRLDNMSPEKSFQAPPDKRDLISQMRGVRQHGMNLKTPRAGTRDPLRLLPNGNQGKAEFTPLMKSVTKNNMVRRLSGRRSGGVETPAYVKGEYVNGATPFLPRMDENSQLPGEHTSSSAGNVDDFTSLPHNVSSSAQSTPLAQLPARDFGGVVNDGNIMTLREQENIIDKIEKENFGLKMKIHFLEEAMSKRGNEFNQAALKENTDLKVNRITLQRELHKFKKNIAQAERDAEIYRLQLEEYKERIRRKHVDETFRVEMETLRTELAMKEKQISKLRTEHESTKSTDEAEVRKLRDEVEDLQAELREKEREVEKKEDEIDSLKMNANKDSNASAELEDELEAARQQVEDLQQDLERAKQEASDAKEDREDAVDQRRKAEENLEELQDEVSNKSFTTKGLSRQLEEKTNKLEDDLEELQERFDKAKSDLDEKVQSERKLQDRLRELEREGASDARNLQSELEVAQQQRDTCERKLNNMAKHAEAVEKELQVMKDEKHLLQTRHDALTTESSQLQKELTRARKSVEELENALSEERQRAAQQDNILRAQHQQELDLLNQQVDSLHRDVNSKENDHATDLEEWEAKRRSLESACQKAEEKANGLQRTVDKIHDAHGTLSSKEMRLREAIESEKQRHQQEEKVLSTQIEELNQNLAAKRQAADSSRIELNNAKEELRISIREQAALKEQVADLEEEIEVLQADIEQEHELVEQFQKKSNASADAQVLILKKDKQNLQESLNVVQLELQSVRRELSVAENDRDELEAEMQKQVKSPNDTFNVDSEKRELKRTAQKLEKEVERLKTERDNLAEANQALEEEINAEVERATTEENRLNEELGQLRSKQLITSDGRDRELALAKNKVFRLESRVKELEDILDSQSKAIASPALNVSGMKSDLAEARENETAAIKRETELKSSNRDLKMRVNDLERELHEARLATYKAKSPSASPPPSHSKELAKIREELVDARAELQDAQSQVRELRRSARHSTAADGAKTDLRARLISTKTEADKLNTKVIEQEDIIASLRCELRQLQRQRPQTDTHDNSLHDLSMRLSTRDSELREMKHHLTRIRAERRAAVDQADAVESELEVLQGRYESMLERLTSGRNSKDELREKEIRDLVKEIMYLKARVRREERLRRDAAWGKKWVESEVGVRVKCNQIDLKILREIGAEVPDKGKYEKKLLPKQKFRAGVFAVIAAMRLGMMESQWRDVKKLGNEVRAVRERARTRVKVREV